MKNHPGAFAPQNASAAAMAAVGVVASTAGQAGSSAASAALDKGVPNVSRSDVNVDPVTAIAGGLGAGVGSSVSRGVASLTAKPIIGTIPLSQAGGPTAVGLTAGAVAEGAITGASEKAVSVAKYLNKKRRQ